MSENSSQAPIAPTPAEIELALETFYQDFAALADEIAPSPRASGVNDRERAQAFLLTLEADSPLLAELRQPRTPAYLRGLFQSLRAFALDASGAEWAALCLDCAAPSPRRRCADCLGGVNADPHDNPLWPSAVGSEVAPSDLLAACVSCAAPSARQYCEQCVRDLSVEPRENPRHADLAAA